MFELYCILTGILIVAFAWTAYLRTNDALHPAVVLSPLFFFMNAAWPMLLNRTGDLLSVVTAESLDKAALLYLVSLAAFYLGLLRHMKAAAKVNRTDLRLLSYHPAAVQRERLFGVSLVFGLLALAAYCYMIWKAGGFVDAYSRAKGGGYAESGYIGDATLLSFPAILFLAMSRRGLATVGPAAVALGLLYVSPHLLQGTFGGRRGPLFLSLIVLYFAWHIARATEFSVKRTLIVIGLIGALVILVWSQRLNVYLGSQGEIETTRVAEVVTPDTVDSGNTYANAVLAISAADYFQNFYWGYRYFVTLLIRPIPKQLWPTKYKDVGADWLYYGYDERTQKYLEATGQLWVAGSAMPAIADGYLEFSWGVVILFYLTGRLFSYAWRQRIARRGLWEILYLIMVMLGIYLATQSYTAWAHRLLFIGIPTALVWRYWVARFDPQLPRQRFAASDTAER